MDSRPKSVAGLCRPVKRYPKTSEEIIQDTQLLKAKVCFKAQWEVAAECSVKNAVSEILVYDSMMQERLQIHR